VLAYVGSVQNLKDLKDLGHCPQSTGLIIMLRFLGPVLSSSSSSVFTTSASSEAHLSMSDLRIQTGMGMGLAKLYPLE
jgi:hypothetical protein